MRSLRYLAIPIGLVVCFLSVSPTQVTAQAVGGIVFSPPLREFTLDPGQTLSWEIAVTNVGAESRTYDVRLREFTSGDSAGVAKFSPEINPDYLSWVHTPAQVTLAPQQTEYMRVQMDVPAGARASYAFAILFADIAGEASPDANAIIVGETGPLVIINIPRPQPGEAVIAEFSNQGSVFRPVLQTAISNLTPYTIKPLGVINNTLSGGLSPQTDLRVQFNNSNYLITSGQARTYLDPVIMPDWAVGIFEAEAVVAYTPENKVITATTKYFYISPYVATVAVAFGLLSTLRLAAYKLKRHA